MKILSILCVVMLCIGIICLGIVLVQNYRENHPQTDEGTTIVTTTTTRRQNGNEDPQRPFESFDLQSAYDYAVEQYDKYPEINRDIGEFQSETSEIIALEGKYYQSFVRSDVDRRYIFLSREEFPTDRESATWDWFPIGTAEEFSLNLLGTIDDGQE